MGALHLYLEISGACAPISHYFSSYKAQGLQYQSHFCCAQTEALTLLHFPHDSLFKASVPFLVLHIHALPPHPFPL